MCAGRVVASLSKCVLFVQRTLYQTPPATRSDDSRRNTTLRTNPRQRETNTRSSAYTDRYAGTQPRAERYSDPNSSSVSVQDRRSHGDRNTADSSYYPNYDSSRGKQLESNRSREDRYGRSGEGLGYDSAVARAPAATTTTTTSWERQHSAREYYDDVMSSEAASPKRRYDSGPAGGGGARSGALNSTARDGYYGYYNSGAREEHATALNYGEDEGRFMYGRSFEDVPVAARDVRNTARHHNVEMQRFGSEIRNHRQ